MAGDEALNVFNAMEFDDEDLAVLKEKFMAYCEPRKNTYLRHMFFTRAQGQAGGIN